MSFNLVYLFLSLVVAIDRPQKVLGSAAPFFHDEGRYGWGGAAGAVRRGALQGK